MKTTRIILFLLFGCAVVVGPTTSDVAAQDAVPVQPKSGAKAFGLSLLIPGLGHRYVNGGRWGGAGTVFVAADVTLWMGLAASISQQNHAINGYTNVVALRSGNTLEGKNRAFELAIGAYDSSQEYIDALLRSRQWDRLESAQDPANQWDWDSREDRLRYVELQDDADAADRRTKALIGGLILNRLISGVTAALSSRKSRQSRPTSLSAQFGYSQYSNFPTAVVAFRF